MLEILSSAKDRVLDTKDVKRAILHYYLTAKERHSLGMVPMSDARS